MEMFNSAGLTPCPSCRAPIQADIFPAAYRPTDSVTGGDTVLPENQAGCFYHSDKKAVEVCSSCGRFICALCDIEMGGRHICPHLRPAGTKGPAGTTPGRHQKPRAQDRPIRSSRFIAGRTAIDPLVFYAYHGASGRFHRHPVLEGAEQHSATNEDSKYPRDSVRQSADSRLDHLFCGSAVSHDYFLR